LFDRLQKGHDHFFGIAVAIDSRADQISEALTLSAIAAATLGRSFGAARDAILRRRRCNRRAGVNLSASSPNK